MHRVKVKEIFSIVISILKTKMMFLFKTTFT